MMFDRNLLIGYLFAIIIVLLSDLQYSVNASYCGTGAIPYSLEVLPSGLPSLGCGEVT